jgi:hypothetical protein
MISLKQCQAYLNECEALGAEAKLTLRRATAVMAVCHAWLALSDAHRWRGSPSAQGKHCGFPRTTIGSFAKHWIPATILIRQLLA